MANWNRLIGSSRDFQRRPDPRRVPPPVNSVAATPDVQNNPDGHSTIGIAVSWVAPTYYGKVPVDVWYQTADGGTNEWQYAGRTRSSPYLIRGNDLSLNQEYRVAVATVSPMEVTIGPENSPSDTVTLTEGSQQPPDVSGFTVVDYGDQLLFQWTPVDSDVYPYVMGYEIRHGSTGWSSATFVTKAGLRNTPWWPVPRPLAPGTTFYIKAVSYAEVYSASPGSATLSSADEASVDAAGAAPYFQEVTITGGRRVPR